MQTPFSNPNMDFSKKAHRCAQEAIYPCLFERPCTFESQGSINSNVWGVLDGKLGIDRIIRVFPPAARSGFMFTAQERFRKPTYQVFGDVTITGWNCATNLPGEIHKLASMFFVYGFYDEAGNCFTDWVVLNTVVFMMALAQGRLRYTAGINPRSKQSFVNITRLDLRHIPGAVVMEAHS